MEDLEVSVPCEGGADYFDGFTIRIPSSVKKKVKIKKEENISHFWDKKIKNHYSNVFEQLLPNLRPTILRKSNENMQDDKIVLVPLSNDEQKSYILRETCNQVCELFISFQLRSGRNAVYARVSALLEENLEKRELPVDNINPLPNESGLTLYSPENSKKGYVLATAYRDSLPTLFAYCGTEISDQKYFIYSLKQYLLGQAEKYISSCNNQNVIDGEENKKNKFSNLEFLRAQEPHYEEYLILTGKLPLCIYFDSLTMNSLNSSMNLKRILYSIYIRLRNIYARIIDVLEHVQISTQKLFKNDTNFASKYFNMNDLNHNIINCASMSLYHILQLFNYIQLLSLEYTDILSEFFDSFFTHCEKLCEKNKEFSVDFKINSSLNGITSIVLLMEQEEVQSQCTVSDLLRVLYSLRSGYGIPVKVCLAISTNTNYVTNLLGPVACSVLEIHGIDVCGPEDIFYCIKKAMTDIHILNPIIISPDNLTILADFIGKNEISKSIVMKLLTLHLLRFYNQHKYANLFHTINLTKCTRPLDSLLHFIISFLNDEKNARKEAKSLFSNQFFQTQLQLLRNQHAQMEIPENIAILYLDCLKFHVFVKTLLKLQELKLEHLEGISRSQNTVAAMKPLAKLTNKLATKMNQILGFQPQDKDTVSSCVKKELTMFKRQLSEFLSASKRRCAISEESSKKFCSLLENSVSDRVDMLIGLDFIRMSLLSLSECEAADLFDEKIKKRNKCYEILKNLCIIPTNCGNNNISLIDLGDCLQSLVFPCICSDYHEFAKGVGFTFEGFSINKLQEHKNSFGSLDLTSKEVLETLDPIHAEKILTELFSKKDSKSEEFCDLKVIFLILERSQAVFIDLYDLFCSFVDEMTFNSDIDNSYTIEKLIKIILSRFLRTITIMENVLDLCDIVSSGTRSRTVFEKHEILDEFIDSEKKKKKRKINISLKQEINNIVSDEAENIRNIFRTHHLRFVPFGFASNYR